MAFIFLTITVNAGRLLEMDEKRNSLEALSARSGRSCGGEIFMKFKYKLMTRHNE